jgi:DNA-binding GntR family transcriptional regulator
VGTGQDPGGRAVSTWNRWEGATAALRGRIGTMEPGSVPSITRQCPVLGVSRRTAALAFRALEAEGLLKRVPGIGYVVLEHPAAPG